MHQTLQIIAHDLAHQLSQVNLSPTEDTTNDKNKHSVHMTDEWLDSVLSLPEMSTPALAFLSNAYRKQGYITLAQASDWLSMERLAVRQGNTSPLDEQRVADESPSAYLHRVMAARWINFNEDASA